MNEQRAEALSLEIFSDPDWRLKQLHMRAFAAVRTAVNEALSEAAEQINVLYENPPEAYARFDLRQGWDYALDLAEQRIRAMKLP